MKKWMTFLCPFCLAASLTVPAFALDYNIAAPGDPEYAKACSIEVIYTADGGARQNTDISKNAALIPPRLRQPQRRCAEHRRVSHAQHRAERILPDRQ